MPTLDSQAFLSSRLLGHSLSIFRSFNCLVYWAAELGSDFKRLLFAVGVRIMKSGLWLGCRCAMFSPVYSDGSKVKF